MLEYGINLNTEEGRKKAEAELKKWHAEFQKYLAANPLKVVIDGKETKIGKTQLTGYRKELQELRDEYRKLTTAELSGGGGQAIIDKYRKLREQVGIYGGTLDQAVKAQDRLKTQTERTIPYTLRQTQAFEKQSGVITQLKNSAAKFLSVYAGVRMIKSLAEITGEFEMQRVSLQAILQDAEKGAAIFERIKDLAVISPFQFKDLVSYTKQLSAFSVPYEELYDTTKMLADLSAGLGVGMDRLILAYGQVKAAAVLRGQEVRQFSESGINIIEELRKKLSEANNELLTTGDVFDYISARKVSFEMVRDILIEMTSEGGKFYKMQEKQAETLKGKISNLADAYQQMMANIGESNDNLLSGAVDATRWLMENYEQTGRVLMALAGTYGTYRAALIAANITEQFMNGTYSAKIRVLRAVTVAQGALNAVMAVNPYVLVTAAVVGLGAAMWALHDRTTAAERAQKTYNDRMEEAKRLREEETQKIRQLVNTVRDETSTRRERQDAINQLQRMYPDIFSNLDIEKVKNLNLADAISKVNEKLERKTDLQTSERVSQIDEELKKLRAEQGKFVFAGTESYQINNLRKIRELEAERLLIVEKIAKDKEASAQAAKVELSDWQKTVQSFTSANDAAFLKMTTDDNTAYNYIKRVRDEYSSLADQYREYSQLNDDGSKKIAQSLREQMKLAGELAKKMGFTLEEKTVVPKTTTPEQKEEEAQVKSLLDEVENKVADFRRKLNVWQTMYDATGQQLDIDFGITFEGSPDMITFIKQKMQEVAGGGLNLDVNFLTGDFKDLLNGKTFDEQTTRKLREMFDEVSSLTLNNEKRIAEMREQYLDFAGQKKKIEENLSREIIEIEKLRAADGNEITEQRLKKARDIANNGISDLQRDILSKYGLDSFLSDGDLSSFVKDKIKAALPLFKSISTATLSELKKIDEVIDTLELPQSLINDFKAAGGDVEQLLKLIEEIKKSGREATGERMMEKFADQINKVVSSVQKLAGALEDSSNKLLSSIGSFIGGLSSGMDEIVNLYKLGQKATTGDIISAGVSGMATIISTISEHVKANTEAQEEWNRAIEESAQRMRLFRIEQEAYKDGIFGMGDPIAPAIAGMKKYIRAMEELSEMTGKLGGGLVQVGQQKVPSSSAYAGFIAGGAGIGAAAGSIIPGIGTAIGAIVGGLFGGVIAGISSLFGSKASTKLVPVFKRLKDQYAWLYNEGFELNPQIISDYSKLDKATQEIIDNWEEIKTKAKEAQEQIEETLKSITGSIGEDLYSALIEAFDNKDLAASMEKFRNSVNKILSDFASRMLFNAVFGDLLDKGEQRMKESLSADGDQTIIDDIDWLGDELEQKTPAFMAGLEAVKTMMAGLDRSLMFGDGTSNLTGVSKSIAGISEDTANILSGTLNSMRYMQAEFSEFFMAGEGRTTMNMFTQNQSSMIANLEAIKHNTGVTAETNAELLSTIKKVTMETGRGTVLKVDL
jgi:DNA polymerase III delta prime subunit